ncbi:MAG: DUF3795 domain-containing protein [Candidatus Bathyarchaeota archaeon]|nr:DUF3795 domain-containing protein [Candidatus Bathyarchaeota archaeon]
MERDWDISVCGLNCAQCDIYRAGKGDEEIQSSLVKAFRESYDMDIAPSDFKCSGCRVEEDNWSPNCHMKQCAINMGVKYCFECPEFICLQLGDFANDGAAHHYRTVENLKRMKLIGVEAWLEEQRNKGAAVFCP